MEQCVHLRAVFISLHHRILVVDAASCNELVELRSAYEPVTCPTANKGALFSKLSMNLVQKKVAIKLLVFLISAW